MKRIDSGKRIRVYLMVGVVIQIISTALFFVSYFKMRESSKSNIMQFTDTHMTQLQKDFSENRIFIENELLSDPDTRLLFHKTGLEYVKAIGELQTYFRIAAQTNDNRYFFFVYDQKTERFIELTRVSIPFSAYRKIRPELTRVIRSGVQNGLWTLNDADGQRFVQSSWTYGDFTLGVWGYEKTLLENVSHLDYGKNGGASFVLKQAAEENKGPKFFKRTLTYDFSFSDIDADFSAEFTLDQHLFFRSLFWLEILEFFLTCLGFVILFFMAYNVRKQLIEPLQNLSLILSKYRNDPLNLADSEEKEEVLEDTYDILNGLTLELDEQRAELYQQELEIKQLQLNFRNAQIRPHFIVNCLAMLSGMASVGEVKKVQEMTVYISRYIRYVLQDCMDMSVISTELDHMKDIIEICRGLNSHNILFEYEIDPEAENVRLPVLVISTFIENSIKHFTYDEDLFIRVVIRMNTETDTLSVIIQDNGEGFSEDSLYMLNVLGEIDEENGRHIGINNVLQRLKLFYGDRAKVLFDNKDGHAVVSLAIEGVHREAFNS